MLITSLLDELAMMIRSWRDELLLSTSLFDKLVLLIKTSCNELLLITSLFDKLVLLIKTFCNDMLRIFWFNGPFVLVSSRSDRMLINCRYEGCLAFQHGYHGA